MKKAPLTLIKKFKAFQLALGENQHFQRKENFCDNLDIVKNPILTSE